MPDKTSVPAFDQCTKCEAASKKGSVSGPFPTSHAEVCCLYKFSRQGQPPLCQKEKHKGTVTCDGLCESCPSKLKYLAAPIPERPAQSNRDGEGTRAYAKGNPKICVRVVPRQRRGYKKVTIEVRPPKFKKKLWFGTYELEDVDRAKDAIYYYVGSDVPFILEDSPRIFSRHKLEIEFRDLPPSCDHYMQVGQKKMLTCAVFARQVKAVIKAVVGKKKGPQLRRQKASGKNGGKKEAFPEPVVSCALGLTSLPCASAMVCEDTSDVAGAAYDASSFEANSALASSAHLPSCEIFTSCQGEISWELSQHEFLNFDPFFPGFCVPQDESISVREGELGAMINDAWLSDLWMHDS